MVTEYHFLKNEMKIKDHLSRTDFWAKIYFQVTLVLKTPQKEVTLDSMCPFLVFIRFGQVSFNYVENWSSSRHVHAEQSTHFDQEQVHSVSSFQSFFNPNIHYRLDLAKYKVNFFCLDNVVSWLFWVVRIKNL